LQDGTGFARIAHIIRNLKMRRKQNTLIINRVII